MLLLLLLDCDLVALLEDDTGMELLVCNKIISLELPVKDVHRKIWCAEHNEVLLSCRHVNFSGVRQWWPQTIMATNKDHDGHNHDGHQQ